MYKKNFVKVNRSMADKIKEIAKDTGVTVSIKWVSIYNRTVIYDYEPFTAEGYDLAIEVEGKDRGYVDFFEYLYNKAVIDINTINRMYGDS